MAQDAIGFGLTLMSISDQLLVRPACEADVVGIVAFSAAMALETERRSLDHARLRDGTKALLADPTHGFFLVAELPHQNGMQLVGQMMVTYEWSDWRNACFWWIQSVYVAPAWRRQGVYRHMHEAVVEFAQADPRVCGIRLYVERDNSIAQSVYTRVGLRTSPYVVYEKDFVFTRHKLQDQPDEA